MVFMLNNQFAMGSVCKHDRKQVAVKWLIFNVFWYQQIECFLIVFTLKVFLRHNCKQGLQLMGPVFFI